MPDSAIPNKTGTGSPFSRGAQHSAKRAAILSRAAGKEIIKYNKTFNQTKFFPDSKINYAENILKKKNIRDCYKFFI